MQRLGPARTEQARMTDRWSDSLYLWKGKKKRYLTSWLHVEHQTLVECADRASYCSEPCRMEDEIKLKLKIRGLKQAF